MTGKADKFVISARARRRDRTRIFWGEPYSAGKKSVRKVSSMALREVGGTN
jgi:hypothetical protein